MQNIAIFKVPFSACVDPEICNGDLIAMLFDDVEATFSEIR